MLADDARRLPLIMMVPLAVLACGRSSGRSGGALDSGTAPEVGAWPDVSTDYSLVRKDSAVEEGSSPADTSLDAPLIVSDSVGRDVAMLGDDTGLDSGMVEKDGPQDVGALETGVDGGYDGLPVARDGHIDSVGAALLTIDPKEGIFGTVWPTPTPPIVFTVSNVGSGPSGTFTITITGDATAVSYFKISDNSCDKSLPAGETCQVAVVFVAPGGAGGPYVTSLNIGAEGIPGGKFTIKLSGETP